jgi:poly(3-hydroxyalkanoate) synthetase
MATSVLFDVEMRSMERHSQAPPPSAVCLQSGLLDSWIDAYGAAIRGITGYLEQVLLGRPPDVTRWLEMTLTRRPPGWSTPHEIVFEEPLARLRDFSTSPVDAVVPTLVLPPQAGHDSCIVDFSAEQSQIRTILASGLERVLSLDWIGATRETAHASIEDYLAVVDRAAVHCGGPINLIGDCQGGWLAAIYAALNPKRVNTLTLAGAPIDFHAGEPVIHEVLRRLAPCGDLRFYEGLVSAGGGVLRGEHMIGGFISINPGDEIARQLELLLKLDDPDHLARYHEFEDWFKHTQDIPGAFYLWIVRHLFRDNELVRDSLRIGGRRVDLKKIDMPLNLLAGASDHITPPDQVLAVMDRVSTPQTLIHSDVTPGGHLGLFMGHQALREHWPPLLAEVLRHSAA